MVAVALAACASAAGPRFGSLQTGDRRFEFEHPIELFEVTNGLRVAMIPDASTNLVTIDVRYDVGSAEDPDGRAGMAHLVEHALFLLRATPDGPTIMDELGELTLHMNAATSWDYTSYTATVAPRDLARVLAIEARRMRPSCDALDDASFLRERDVVLNEDRESFTPGSATMYRALEEVYGKNHPYTRPIGSPEIATATRAEVCKFISDHYAPERAKLVISGRIDPEEVQALVGRTFAPIARANLGPRAPAPAAILNGRVSRHPAPVERPTVLVFFPFAPWGSDGVVGWHVAAAAVRAVVDDADDDHGWITSTQVAVLGGERAPVLVVEVEVTSADLLERGAEQVFARTAILTEELPLWAFRNLVGHMSFNYIANWDNRRVRGDWIAKFMQFTDHNWFMLRELRTLASTRWNEKLPAMAAKLVQANSHVAMLLPSGNAATKVATAVPTTSHDVGVWRSPVDPAEAEKHVVIESEPADLEVDSYELANGLVVQLAPDPSSPVFDARLVFPVGTAHAPADDPHLAEAAALLLMGSEEYGSSKVHQKLYFGLSRGTYSAENVTETSTTFSARGPALWADWHLWYLSWRLERGLYRAGDVRAIHKLARQLGKDDDDDERTDPAFDVMRARLFGADHPYATGAASVESLAKIQVGALQRWRAQHFGARGATLVISGGFDKARMMQEVEELFGPWADVPRPAPPEIPPIRPATGPSWLASDRPDALQTQLIVAVASGSDRDDDEPARMVLEAMLADELRVVREGMGATYGLTVVYHAGPAGGALVIETPVEEGSAPAVLERILETVRRYRADAAGQREAFVRARKAVLARALAERGGATAVASSLEGAAIRRKSPQHNRALAGKLAALTPAEVGRVAGLDLDETHLVVLVRGKPASVNAAFARVQVTPERPEPADAPEETVTEEPEPPKAPYTGPTREEGQRLYVGSIYAISGPREEGLFLNERKLTLDEFLTIGGADHVRRRMWQRKWIRRGMIGGGAVTLVVGVAMALTAESCPANLTVLDQQACQERRSGAKQTGGAIAGVGLLSAALGSQVGKGAPSEEELRAIALTFNQRPVAVAPAVTPGGVQLTVSGRF